jgi:hypothetical protein
MVHGLEVIKSSSINEGIDIIREIGMTDMIVWSGRRT